ncbi:MAG: 2-hydroxychromene-2-carboxylate isomerase [Sandaracinaceae bacterium]
MAERVRFLFDYISPYAYLAWTQIHRAVEPEGAVVEPVPVLFAAMLNAHGHKGPAEIAPKRIFVWKDVVRRAHRYGVPIQPPPAHPFNPLPALRATVAVGEEDRGRAIDALFAATWGDAAVRGIDGPEQVLRALAAAGIELDPASLSSAAVKDAVRVNTDAALAAGCFGVPTMLVGEELFWGTDNLDFVVDHLRGADPVARDELERWRDLPSAAKR